MMMKIQKNRNAWQKYGIVNTLKTPPPPKKKRKHKSCFQGISRLIKRSQAPPGSPVVRTLVTYTLLFEEDVWRNQRVYHICHVESIVVTMNSPTLIPFPYPPFVLPIV